MWCRERDLDPLVAERPHIELYVRWMQEVQRYKPSTVSRRALGARRLLPHLRHRQRPRALTSRLRPTPTRPTGVTDPRPEPPAVRSDAHRRPRLDQPQRLRTGRHARPARTAHLRGHRSQHRRPQRSHGHRVLRVHGKGDKIVLVPLPPAVGRAIDRAVADRPSDPILLQPHRPAAWTGTPPPAASARSPRPAGIQLPRMHPHMLRHTYVTTMLDAGVRPPRRPDRRPPRRPANHHALRPSPQEPRPAPQLHPRRLHGLRNLIPRGQPADRGMSGRLGSLTRCTLRHGTATWGGTAGVRRWGFLRIARSATARLIAQAAAMSRAIVRSSWPRSTSPKPRVSTWVPATRPIA